MKAMNPTIDYSGYTIKKLLDVKSRLERGCPDNYKKGSNYNALMAELETRKDQIEKYHESKAKVRLSKAKNRVKIVGYCQIAAAIGIAVYLIVGLFSAPRISTLSILIGVFLVALNLVAGYTAIKGRHQLYWISVANQVLQVPSVAVGSIVANYSGLGGAYVMILWGEGLGLWFSANFSPGFAFYKYNQNLQSGYIAIDVIALVFIAALLTVKSSESTAKKSQPTQ